MAMRRHQDPVAALHRKYQPVPISRIAPVMKRAAMIGEDNRFYVHDGVDFVEMRHAMGYPRDTFKWSDSHDRDALWRAIGSVLHDPGKIRGASTITQQLAKNLYLSPSRNPLRKVKEAFIAWRLEFWLPKERIMELYLNTVELGEEVWGVEAASQRYFKSSAKSLSAEQAAMLAATLPFPRSSNLYYRPGRMLWRKNMILDRLLGRVAADSNAVQADSGR